MSSTETTFDLKKTVNLPKTGFSQKANLGQSEPARLKILRCELADGSGAAGELLDDRLTIACQQGALRIRELQRAGGLPMKAEDFLRGTSLKPPMRLT